MNFILIAISFMMVASMQRQRLETDHTSHDVDSEFYCPSCGSSRTVKNGSTHNNKPKRQCKDCDRQFVTNAVDRSISSETKQLINRLLLERISLRGIVRATGVSFSWLQNYVNSKFSQIPQHARVTAKNREKIIIECDELWSFVFSKKNKFYVWLAIDRGTREIIGCYVGDRTRKSATKLWANLPSVYRQCAVAYTDFWEAIVQ